MKKFKQRWQLTEYIFEQFMAETFPRGFLYRFPDYADLNFKSGRKLNVVGRQGAAEQPADYLFSNHGETAFMEVKATKSKTSFAFKDVQGSQWRAAYKQVKAESGYYFVIEAYELGVWFKVPAALMVACKKAGKKSVSFKEIDHCQWFGIQNFFSTMEEY